MSHGTARGDGRAVLAGDGRWGSVAAVMERIRACSCTTAPTQQPQAVARALIGRPRAQTSNGETRQDGRSRERGVMTGADDASRHGAAAGQSGSPKSSILVFTWGIVTAMSQMHAALALPPCGREACRRSFQLSESSTRSAQP